MTSSLTTVDELPAVTPYGALHREPEGTKRRVQAHVRDGIRTFGRLTGGLRMLPDYLIIGTKRGGTTSLARWLLEHPETRSLFPARETRKGTYYFDVNYGQGLAWYQSHFPTRAGHELAQRHHGGRLLVGEATPYYLHHPHAPTRARQLIPGTKVIALLRHPVDRAPGHWAERSRQGVEHLGFDEALEAEDGRLHGEEERMLADPGYVSYAHQHYSYIDQGRYARGLRRWMTAFPEQQLLILRAEDLYADPVAVFTQVLDFLGLGGYTPSELNGWNRVEKDALDPATRQRLRSLLDPDIAETEALLGRSMDWT